MSLRSRVGPARTTTYTPSAPPARTCGASFGKLSYTNVLEVSSSGTIRDGNLLPLSLI